MTDFDLSKVSGTVSQKLFKSLYNPNHISSQKALKDQLIQKDSELFVVKIDNEQVIAFSKKTMAYYHFAQGYLNKKPYLLTFCVICNSGMVLNPEVNGTMLHFEVKGVYNGMVLMMDKETGSYWDHITGVCIHGIHKGYQLEVLHSHLVLTAAELVQHYPNSVYGLPKLNFLQRWFGSQQYHIATVKKGGFLPPFFRKSMQKNDDRLPEMEMGLGVWEGKKKAKFYPTNLLKKQGGFLIDSFNNQQLLVYISPTSGTPNALYIPNDLTVEMQKDRLTLSNGYFILSGKLFAHPQEELTIDQPGQMFSRWYGFIATFPNCLVAD